MKIMEWLVAGLTSLAVVITSLALVGCGAEADDSDDQVVANETEARERERAPAAEPSHEDRVARPEPREGETSSSAPVAAQTRAERSSTDAQESHRRGETARDRQPQRVARASHDFPPARPGRRARVAADRAPTAPDPSSPDLEPEIVERDGLMINRVVMARDIEDRTPVDEGTSFRTGDAERIYAYLEVANPERERQELTVAWLRGTDTDDVVSQVAVDVGPHPRWRTWAYTSRLRRPGRYTVVVRDAEDEVLARAPFEVIQ